MDTDTYELIFYTFIILAVAVVLKEYLGHLLTIMIGLGLLLIGGEELSGGSSLMDWSGSTSKSKSDYFDPKEDRR